jgi:hypothetical protein
MDINKLNEDQIFDLNKILKIIIPSDQNKGLPGADEIKFLDFLEKFHPYFIEELSRELSVIHSAAEKKYLRSMKELNEAELFSLLTELKKVNDSLLNELTLLVYEGYYQHQSVLEILNINGRAPFPLGHEVVKGDYKLLGPVKKMKKIYKQP